MELLQKRGFHRKRFVIQKNILRIETKDTNSTEAYEVSYEEIGDRITTTKASKRIFVFTLFPTIVLMMAVVFPSISGELLQKTSYWIMLVLFSAISLVLYFSTNYHRLVISGGRHDLEFFRDKPSAVEVDAFVAKVLEQRKNYLKKKYTTFDDTLSLDAQMSQLYWCKNNGIISEEEYDSLRESIPGVSLQSKAVARKEPPEEIQEKELYQRRNIDFKRFRITNSGVEVTERDSKETKSYDLKYEEIGNNLASQKLSRQIFYIVLVIIPLFFITTFFNGMSQDIVSIKELLIRHLIILPFAIILLIIVYRVSGKETLTLTGGPRPVELYADRPSHQAAKEFIQDILNAREIYLRRKYARIDLFLPVDLQLETFIWLHEIGAISKQEFEKLKIELTAKAPLKQIGFHKN